MVFDQHGTDRIAAWKEFRDKLENSDNPLKDVADLWSNAPFVGAYLDPKNPSEWPDPWHLILDLRLDDLAIALGMLYTIKLTRRFMDIDCEIHMSMLPDKKDPNYFVVVDNKHVLNLEYKNVVGIEKLQNLKTSLIWSNFKP
jgi:hypothetical protein